MSTNSKPEIATISVAVEMRAGIPLARQLRNLFESLERFELREIWADGLPPTFPLDPHISWRVVGMTLSHSDPFGLRETFTLHGERMPEWSRK